MSVEGSTVSVERPGISASAVDRENPWPGLSTFTEEQTAFFFGREEEVRELMRRIERKALTVLFGQSGLGKSSLLQAGVFPRLRAENFCPVYVRLDHSASAPPLTEQIKSIVFRESARAGTWTQTGISTQAEDLWEFFHHRDDRLQDAAGKLVVPVLVFDQFEELFTLGAAADPETRRRATAFIAELADLVENRPPARLEARLEESAAELDAFDFARADYRVLITLREDYLPHLESLKSAMPSLMQNRMRLTRMQASRALEAVMKPGEGLVTEEVAQQIVGFVSGHTELEGAEVEPSLLSLVCRELNNQRRARGEPAISTGLLAGTRDTILREFYERTMEDQPAAVRHFIEDELLTDSGYRENIALDRARRHLADAGADPHAIDVLVNRRLLRIEERLDVRRVELTHDVLCSVLKSSRNVRLEREALEKAERLLKEQQLREAATRQALNRARKIATVCSVLLLLAAGNAIFGFLNLRRARAAEAQAEATWQLAERARGEAEKLVGFLLEDFYDELEPTGRLETVGRLARQAVVYYDGLPADLLTSQTLRYRGMALVRQGAAMFAHGDVNGATPVLKKAQAIFEKLRAGGDETEETTIGLALSLFTRVPQGLIDSATLKDLEQATTLVRARAAQPAASRRIRRVYADVLNVLSHTQPKEVAVNTCEEARKILVGLGALDLSDLRSASAYGDITDSEARHALALGRLDDAEKLEKEVYELADKILIQRPGDLRAMFGRCWAPDALAQIAALRLDYAGALAFVAKSDRAAEDYVRFNPSNAQGWKLWISARNRAVKYLLAQGKVSEALTQARASAALEHDPRNTTGTDEGLFEAWGTIARLEGHLGHRPAADEALQESRRISGLLPKQLRLGQSLTRLMAEAQLQVESDVRLAFGEYPAVFADSTAALSRIAKVTAENGMTESLKSGATRGVLGNIVIAGIRTGHVPEAESAARTLSEETLKDMPPEMVKDTAAFSHVLLAHTIALQGRRAEVPVILDPAIAHYREQQTKVVTNLGFLQKVARAFSNPTAATGKGTASVEFLQKLAYALYVQGLAQAEGAPGRTARRTAFDEATRTLDDIPEEAKPLRETRQLYEWIAEAKAKPGY